MSSLVFAQFRKWPLTAATEHLLWHTLITANTHPWLT